MSVLLDIREALEQGEPVPEIALSLGIPESKLWEVIGDGFWKEIADRNAITAPKPRIKRSFKAKSPENYLKGRNHRLLSYVLTDGAGRLYVNETYNLANAIVAVQEGSWSDLTLLTVIGTPLAELQAEMTRRIRGNWFEHTRKNSKVLGIPI